MKKTAFEIEMRSLKDKVEGLMPIVPSEQNMSDSTRGYAQAIKDVLKIVMDEIRNQKQESIEWAARPSHFNSDDLREDDR